MHDVLIAIVITATITAAFMYYGLPAVGESCDRRRWYIAVRKRRRELRICTTQSLDWHRRAERAAVQAEQWDERLTYVADSDNIDWLPPSWLPVLPARERSRQPANTRRPQPQRKARWAPRLDNIGS